MPAALWQSTLQVNEKIGLTTSKDILQAVGEGMDPHHLLVTLGYAGWSEGQLEQELAANAWLSVPGGPWRRPRNYRAPVAASPAPVPLGSAAHHGVAVHHRKIVLRGGQQQVAGVANAVAV